MAVPFDHIASPYDSLFSRSAVGQLQSKHVWRYVESVIPQLGGIEMLELNCGGGEDADLFGERGFNLVATDIGEEMLKITQQKAEQVSMQNRITSHYLDLDGFNETLFDKQFDLVFSNFGGLNGVNPDALKKLFQKLPSIIKPGGRFIGVIMPKLCVWETVFFTMRFQFRRAFRRIARAEIISDVQGRHLKAWFYQPSQIKKWSKERFKLVSIKPVGLALPSAYLEGFIRFRKNWLLKLNNLEKKFGDRGLFAGMADNFIIDLQLKA